MAEPAQAALVVTVNEACDRLNARMGDGEGFFYDESAQNWDGLADDLLSMSEAADAQALEQDLMGLGASAAVVAEDLWSGSSIQRASSSWFAAMDDFRPQCTNVGVAIDYEQ